jgi:hypothetical protein
MPNGVGEAECLAVPEDAIPPNPLASEYENQRHKPSREPERPQQPALRFHILIGNARAKRKLTQVVEISGVRGQGCYPGDRRCPHPGTSGLPQRGRS